MKIIYNNFKINVEKKDLDIKTLFLKKLRIDSSDILSFEVIKESVDARDKNNLLISYNVLVDIKEKVAVKLLKDKNAKVFVNPDINLLYPKWKFENSPIIVGFGPAGIFAALYLARTGANPIIIERGKTVDERVESINNFIKTKKLNPNSNIQFGEGGAGTFSDGKLTTNLNDKYLSFIIDEFIKFGAPKEIRYKSNPHVGTDYLRIAIKNIRIYLEKLGAKFYFDTTFCDYKEQDDKLVVFAKHNNQVLKFNTKHLILGIGHSARDTFKLLASKNETLEAKDFSMGVRIEHLREKINEIQYGKAKDMLQAANYKMAIHLPERSVYTFCMCPGGEVVASQSEEGSIVTNGMSYYKRDNDNSNAALLVEIKNSDFLKDSVLDGMYFQEEYERKAFEISKDYKAPGNLVAEFMEGKIAKEFRSVKTTYPFGIKFCDLNECLPDYVVDSLREALPLFDRKMKGFMDPDAILVGVETRSSSPVRILRDEFRKSLSNKYIYPIGEGAGYAGGISSSALDGLKTAMMICGETYVHNKEKEQ